MRTWSHGNVTRVTVGHPVLSLLQGSPKIGSEVSGVPAWQEAIPAFLNSLDVSSNTVRTYEEALKSFTRWLASHDGTEAEPSPETVRAYREWLKGERSANTVLTYWVALRRFFQYAVVNDHIQKNPVEGLKGLRRPRGHLRRDLTRGELRAVFEAIDTSTELGKRDYAMINLMARNGLRIVEIHRANVGDLEARQHRQIMRIWGKGRDERDEFVVLAEPTEAALDDYLDTRGAAASNEPLFTKASGSSPQGEARLSTRHIRRRITRYFELAGVKTDRTSVHSLRHSFVTLAIEGGATLMEAQAAARHRSIQTTMVYFHEHGRLDNPVEDRIDI
ncbi:MAG: tyrosine-type recombinase/integrase [Candidatus Bipolaricaulia bacterium]